MAKKLISIGFDYPGSDIESVSFESNRSLLDTDIILVHPIPIYKYIRTGNTKYQGKNLLGEKETFRVVEAIDHWQEELQDASASGKTIVVFLREPEFCYVRMDYQGIEAIFHTNEKFVLINSYSLLPMELGPINSKLSKEVKLGPDGQLIGKYWKEVASYSKFEVLIEGKFNKVLLQTKNGDKVIAAMINDLPGHYVLLPVIDFEQEAFGAFDDKHGPVWTDKCLNFTNRFISSLIDIDKSIRGDSDIPKPEWVSDHTYKLIQENSIEEKIIDIEGRCCIKGDRDRYMVDFGYEKTKENQIPDPQLEAL